MNGLLKAIVQTGIFMVCSQAVVHFRPNGSYEKYLKLLVSIMILIQVFLPVMSLFKGGMEQLEEKIGRYQEQLTGSMEQSKELEDWTAERLNRMTLEEIRKRIEEQKTAAPKEEGTQDAELRAGDMQEDETGEGDTGGEDIGEKDTGERDTSIHIDKIEINLDGGGDADGKDKEKNE